MEERPPRPDDFAARSSRREFLDVLGAGIDAGRLIDWQGVGPGGLLASVREIVALRNRLDGLLCQVLAAAEASGLARACGNRSLAFLLTEHTRIPLRTARDLVRLAAATTPDPDTGQSAYPRLRHALRHGESGAADTAAMVRTLDQLPSGVRAAAEAELCAACPTWTRPASAEPATSSRPRTAPRCPRPRPATVSATASARTVR